MGHVCQLTKRQRPYFIFLTVICRNSAKVIRIGAGAGLRTRELLRDRILSPAPLTKLGCGVTLVGDTPALDRLRALTLGHAPAVVWGVKVVWWLKIASCY